MKKNIDFFIFLFLLGFLTLLIDKNIHIKPICELFVDISILTLISCLLSNKIRHLFNGFVFFILYATTIIEQLIIINTNSQYTPTIIQVFLQTNENEATDALLSYLSLGDFINIRVFSYILLVILHVLYICNRKKVKTNISKLLKTIKFKNKTIFIRIAFFSLFLVCTSFCYKNIYSLATIYVQTNHYDLQQKWAHYSKNKWLTPGFYLPFYRLIYSLKANYLNADVLHYLEQTHNNVKIDSCFYKSKEIVLIIGESCNKKHMSLYGYNKNTTPYQLQEYKTENLFPFTEAISSWNLTCESFQQMFSMHSYGDGKEWYDVPLFTALFKKAGYHVTFITNQFVQTYDEGIADFQGGLFLNTPTLSNIQFSARNTHKYKWDEMITNDVDSLVGQHENNLTIFHLFGQHFKYGKHINPQYYIFNINDYSFRNDLDEEKKQILADYDNATLYNDFAISKILNLYKDKDVIVVFVSDHGEMVFDNCDECYRNHSTEPYAIIQQYEIPFWIWCSDKYKESHQDVVNSIKNNLNKKFMSDNLAQLMVGLAGITTKYNNAQNNILSKEYNEKRERLIRGTINYDKQVSK